VLELGWGEWRDKEFGNSRRRNEKTSTWGQSRGKGYQCPVRNRGWDQGKGKQKNVEKEHQEI